MNLYIVRHGMTVWNEQKRTQGRVHNKLCKVGINESNSIANELKNISIDHIFCSPLLRAVQTANIINKYINKKVIKDERLTDVEQGYFTGKYFDKLTEQELKIKKQRDKTYGMESLEEIFNRVKDFYLFLKKEYYGKTILIVTHSGVAKFIEYVILNDKFDETEFSKLLPYKNCELRCFNVK